jgi:hypothetical protein
VIRRTYAVGVLSAIVLGSLTLMPSALATTEPGYQFVVSFHLTDTGIVTKGPRAVPRGYDVQFLIVNQSTQHRRFYLGGRETPLLGPHMKYVFFLGMETRGAYPYRSSGPHVKTFHGAFRVH